MAWVGTVIGVLVVVAIGCVLGGGALWLAIKIEDWAERRAWNARFRRETGLESYVPKELTAGREARGWEGGCDAADRQETDDVRTRHDGAL